MPHNLFLKNFLGNTPIWYKYTILIFLLINIVLFYYVSPFIASWCLVLEFIFTLAMTLKCYPLQTGGLLAIEAILIGMTSTEQVKTEIYSNFEVILLLICMVAGIHFIKDLLLTSFASLFVHIRSKIKLSLVFCISAALMSAFLDALTVIAVIISVCIGFYTLYYSIATNKVNNLGEVSLNKFRVFLQSIIMQAAIGTALGGVLTMVGEPQNLIIAETANWNFVEFFLHTIPVTLPIFCSGILLCYCLEKFAIFGYGETLPLKVWATLARHQQLTKLQQTKNEKYKLYISCCVVIWLIINLILHTATVGLIGLSVIILATSFTGINNEHEVGKSFTEAMPFTVLLLVFFVIVAVITQQQLFVPMVTYILTLPTSQQPQIFYLLSGLLSSISDNVFVGTIYIDAAKQALLNGAISKEHFDLIAVAINVGTNIPSIATPNGQAAFLFLLTSPLTPSIRLSYLKMVYMALPYTIILSIVGWLSVVYTLSPITNLFISCGFI